MNHSAAPITDAFLDMELKLSLFDRTIDGVYFWERIRFGTHRRILEGMGAIRSPHEQAERTLWSRWRQAFRSIGNIVARNPLLCGRKDIMFFGHPRRKLGHDGKWWDIYCDPIIRDLQYTSVLLEGFYVAGHLRPARTRVLRYLDAIYYASGLGRRLGIARPRINNWDRRLLHAVDREIQARFGVDAEVADTVARMLSDRRGTLRLYRSLLGTVNPKLVILVVSYGKETLIEACKELHIPVVELQHGVINRHHMGYSYPGERRKKRNFPDYLFLFGDYWANGVEFPIDRDRIVSVGYPYLESEMENYSTASKRDQLIFISQGTIGKQLSKFAVGLADRADVTSTVVYKLHPGEYSRWRKEYPWLSESKVRVIDSERVPLYRLLAESTAQVGVCSTALYEGLQFGLATFLVDLPGVEYMRQLLDSQYASLVASPDELAASLRQMRGSSRMPTTEEFFKPKAAENARNAIAQLIRPC